MSIVVSHETRRVAAARLRRPEHGRSAAEKPAENPIESPVDPDQPDALMELFGEALAHWCPRSVAELAAALPERGAADAAPVARKRAGLDVNFWYLDEPGNRYIRKCSLELHCEDLTGQHVDVERVKLVHAPLVFEHLTAGQLLEDALALIAPGGALSVILQLPEEFEGKVSRGLAPSIHRRKAQFSVINPVWLRDTLGKYSFRLTHESRRSLASGRKLWLGIFAK
jgi:hypothetical protein